MYFMELKEKLCSKLAGSKARVLSQTCKTVLIKANLAVIPLFIMRGVKIRNYIAKEINKANINFFWKYNLDHDTYNGLVPSISWDKICRPKCEVGLGIRKTQDINAAL